MKPFMIIVFLSFLSSPASAQCTNATTNFTDAQLQDSNQHSTGAHSAATGVFDPSNPTPPGTNNVTGTCTYTDPGGGATVCNTSCSVALTGSHSTAERGTLNSVGTHQIFWNSASGQAAAVGGGANCTGAFGGGAANCGPGGCQNGILNITISGNGATASIGGLAGGTQIWATASAFPLTCAVRQVHSSGGGNPGGCTPTPASVPGPVGYSYSNPDPCTVSPILIDTRQEGFHLTSADAGTTFDITGTGHPVQMAWTDPHYHNAFLALPGPDGLVHNGKELFGNFTPQPQSSHPNGFLALAEYDRVENGGNGDGVIDEKDAIFSRLRLWIDENHDGICQANELHTLPELGVYSLALSYFESRRTDEFGNQFRYKARVNPGQQRDPRDETPTGDPGRWAYDVFFVTK